jgi:hypothetical protein
MIPSPAIITPLSTPLCLSIDNTPLNNRLQLPGVPQRILDDLPARTQNVLLAGQQVLVLLREVQAALLDDPRAPLCELYDCAFRLKEEEVFGVGDWDGGVGLLGAGCDFVADRVDEELEMGVSFWESFQISIGKLGIALTPEKMLYSSPGTLLAFVSAHTRS